MSLKQVAKKFEDRSLFSKPIIVRWCSKHQRFEWFDPVNRWGGVAESISSLKDSLAERFLCRQCGSYHVYYIYFYNLSTGESCEMRFEDFISRSDEE